MLQNAYLLAKIGADTAENEQHFAEIWPKTGNYPHDPAGRSSSFGSTEGRRTSSGEPSALERLVQPNAAVTSAPQQTFANFWRARSRLYQNEILQENMRLTAFFKLYKICILLHRCNLKIFAKNRFEKSADFVKIQQKFCECRKICKMLPNFKDFSVIIW